MANITPLHDRLLVKRTENETKTASGIIIPDSAQEKTYWGTVQAVGEGRLNKDGDRTPLAVKKGDTVIFAKYTGTEFKFEDTDYLILKEDEVLGIINK
ncbi:MAG: co-chaperone GroES [Candidatus Dependentiae bacterium]|jgi:chaperonin GroES